MAGVIGRTTARLTVDSRGGSLNCQISESSGSPILDKRACELLMRRARFHPALDEHGLPIMGVSRQVIKWMIGGFDNMPSSVDVTLWVQALPPGVKSPIVVSPKLLVGADGEIEDCMVSEEETPPPLQRAACAQARTQLRIKATIDASGTPQRSVQDVSIGFVIDTKNDRK